MAAVAKSVSEWMDGRTADGRIAKRIWRVRYFARRATDRTDMIVQGSARPFHRLLRPSHEN